MFISMSHNSKLLMYGADFVNIDDTISSSQSRSFNFFSLVNGVLTVIFSSKQFNTNEETLGATAVNKVDISPSHARSSNSSSFFIFSNVATVSAFISKTVNITFFRLEALDKIDCRLPLQYLR